MSPENDELRVEAREGVSDRTIEDAAQAWLVNLLGTSHSWTPYHPIDSIVGRRYHFEMTDVVVQAAEHTIEPPEEAQ